MSGGGVDSGLVGTGGGGAASVLWDTMGLLLEAADDDEEYNDSDIGIGGYSVELCDLLSVMRKLHFTLLAICLFAYYVVVSFCGARNRHIRKFGKMSRSTNKFEAEPQNLRANFGSVLLRQSMDVSHRQQGRNETPQSTVQLHPTTAIQLHPTTSI